MSKKCLRYRKRKYLDDNTINNFVDLLTDFYSKYGRNDLPWRKNINPYRVLVSEVMLQQTQVERVVPKFVKWMTIYPSLEKLKDASLREVLIIWQGLGYQRRPKGLLSIAKNITKLPKSYKELIELPSVGNYTASAIMAFAYNIFDSPVVETNIRTVIIEFFLQSQKEVDDIVISQILNEIITHEAIQKMKARHFYYALMDLGAHLKSKGITHNNKVRGHRAQTKFRGSRRELRAKILFAITHGQPLPQDERSSSLLQELEKEDFVQKVSSGYVLK